jgi:hypothetical protein
VIERGVSKLIQGIKENNNRGRVEELREDT